MKKLLIRYGLFVVICVFVSVLLLTLFPRLVEKKLVALVVGIGSMSLATIISNKVIK